MGTIAWQSAQGDAPSVTLPVASTVPLAPADDSVDTNNVVVSGTGTIASFGPAPLAVVGAQTDANDEIVYDDNGDAVPIRTACAVTKRVTFLPTGGSITLQNGAMLHLLGGANRIINNKTVGTYSCDPTGVWTELYQQDTTTTGGGGGGTGPAGPPGAGYLATSTSSVAIGLGSKTLTTQAGLAYSVGARARASSSASPTNWLEGLVTAYSGTSLTINADLINGSGTFAAWNINLAGELGDQGPPGVAGPPGASGIPSDAPSDGVNYTRRNAAWNNIDTVIATKAPLASPVFTGDPQAPTPATADNDTSVATTAFVKAQGYLGDAPNDANYYARHAAAWAALDTIFAKLASPALTGTPTAPTAATADNSTTLATTAFVKAQAYAPLASPTLTGDPKAPTPTTGDNDTSIATTAFVQATLAAAGYIPDAPNDANYYGRHAGAWSNLGAVFAALASPTFTGDPKAPTPTAGDNDTSIATTAFVSTAITNAAVPAPSSATPAMDGTGAAGSATAYARGDHVHPTDTSRAPLASPTFTGDPKAPTPTAGDNDTSIATTAFVQTAIASVGGVVTQAPTVQRITAAGAFTYTPTNAGGNTVRWIRIRCAASGGGGAANNGGAGNDAADLTFSQGGTLALTLGGGKKGNSIGGGAGGLVTVGTLPANWQILFSAGGGAGMGVGTLSQWAMGGGGGTNMFGGNGMGGAQGSGTNAQDGTGAGGGGQAYALGSAGASGGGGGAGACAEIIIINPGTGILFTGVLGNFGAGGSGAGRGGLGSVNIEEHYNY